VHLYNYLLAGAYTAGRETEEPPLVDTDAVADLAAGSDLVGPFRVRVPLKLTVADGQEILNTDGFAIDDTVQPGTDFYLRRVPGTSAITLTATTPQTIGGRVLTGVALDGAPQRLTPVALTVPTELTSEFDIRWDEPWDDI
jgi:hypothetical protein